MERDLDGHDLDTRLAHFGEDEKHHGAVVPPLYANSLFLFDRSENLHDAMRETPGGPPHHYSRISNPTVDLAERKIADLEGAEAAKLTGCGMAAITDAVMSCVEAGSHVVIPDTAYPPARQLIGDYLAKFGVTHTLVNGSDPDEVRDALRPETTLVYLESPSSFLFRLQDTPAIAAECRARGISTVFDNTYSSPLHFNPLAHGVDLVCHSVTKYMGGHSDLTAGVVCGSRERLDRIVRSEIALLGNLASPFPAWLVTRGLRTLRLRLERHQRSANEIASWLEARPEVERVHHVGLPSHPQAALFRRDFRGSGGVFSFEPTFRSRREVFAFCDALTLFGRGISWGGFESLVVPLYVKPSDYGEGRWIVRLFIGLEGVGDLVQDLSAAFDVVAGLGSP